LKNPVFIVGMPRSGSTFLHQLLAADPMHRAPQVWEVMSPISGPPGQRIRKAEFCLWWFRRLAPQADSVYPMRARTPHECVAIQSYTFLSEEFVSTCQIATYKAFLRSTNLRPAYEWERSFLQHLQLGCPEKRWVLKSPDHAYGLEELFAVFPDAYLIQTHRNPIEVLASSADLTRVLHGLYGRSWSRERTLEHEARMLSEKTERSIQFRDRHPELADRFIDVKYSELIADPLAEIRRIYARLETSLTKQRAEAIACVAASHSRYSGPRASAKANALRFDPSPETGVFERYCQRFGLPMVGIKTEQ
jgi:hypothetical protein